MEIIPSNSQVDGYLVGDNMSSKHAVMALSGGMDSTSLLLHLLNEGFEITCLSFDYGQKHSIELERATSFVEYLSKSGYDVRHNLVDLKSALGLFESDLLERGGDVPEGHYEQESMKATVVPNRNAIFSSLLYGTALSISEQTSCKSIVALGVHSGDHAIYPDCRPEFYTALEHAFAIGNWGSESVAFYLPYLDSDKFGILQDAEQSISNLNLDFDEVFSRTITSYSPDLDGRSSGKTGSDVERILAFHKLGRRDPIEYMDQWDDVLSHAIQTEKIHRDKEYKERLTEIQYHVTRESGTERAFTGHLYDEKRPGYYYCICCNSLLFESTMKFDSGCGWPSFHTEHRDAGIVRIEDRTHGMLRIEVRCRECDAHLGHVFPDGPAQYGGERYCINSASLTFELEEKE
ncbi:MAG: peptide-methionine (R)-S-oxide reductase [Euryarchaeota archaeon]|nr:peptide-methionine (R)-S-oxide reductase [Euryarchaeota archaeon]